MLRFLALTVAAFVVAACARTDVSSFTDPSRAEAEKYTSVMVAAFGMPFDEIDATETTVVTRLLKTGVNAVRRVDHMMPTRQYSEEETWEILRASGVDTVLIVSLTGQGTKESYVPPTYIPGKTSGSVSVIGNTAFFNSSTTPSHTVGGFKIAKPRASYLAQLYDLDTGQMIWAATAQSRGNAFASYRDLAASMAGQTVEKLLADQIF